MKNRQTLSWGERIFEIFNFLFMIIIIICTLYPFWYVIVCSFSSIEHVTQSPFILWPDGIHLEAYQQVFKNNLIPTAYANTLFITIVGTLLSMLLTILGAFVLSRRELPGRTIFTFFVVFTMLFGGGMIPFYLTVKNVGLLQNRWSLILPFLMSTYNMVIMRNFFQSIPNDLYEAAMIDGANYTRFLLQILLPVSKASLATITLFYAVGYWNSYFWSTMFLTDRAKWPMQAILRQILMAGEMDRLLEDRSAQLPTEMVKDAMIVITAMPIICVYPFVQRYFIKGVMVGSLKG